MIRGKKNFLPPHPLIMGFGLLFRLDESSLGSHLNERRVRGEEEGIDDVEESEPFKEISDSESEKEVTNEKLPLESVSIADDVTDSTAKVSSSYESVQYRTGLNGVNSENISDVLGNGVASVTPELEDLIDRALGLGPTTALSSKNYEVETSQVDLNEEHGHEEKKAIGRDKPHISKAERRKLRRGQRNGAAENIVQENEELTENNISVGQPEKNVQNSKPGGGKISRGQRSKLKKMKEKYANQDEEERSVRMALLAVSTITFTG